MAEQPAEVSPSLHAVNRLTRFIALWAGGLILIALMTLTVSEVTLRYVFNSPIEGGKDISQILLQGVFALSIGYSARSGGQVAVELFGDIIGKGFTRWTAVVIKTMAAVMLAILVWRMVESGFSAAELGEASQLLLLPLGPLYHLIAAGTALYVIVLVAEIAMLATGRSAPVLKESSDSSGI